MAKLTLQARREMPQTLTLRPPAATSPALSAKDPGAQPTSSSPSLAVPTSAVSSSGGIHRSIKDTWGSRNRSSTSTNITSPILSPAYSTYEVPLTPFSAVPTNFSRHHPQFQFLDSPDEVNGDHSDDLSGTYRDLPISASDTLVVDGASTDSLPRPCSFGDLVMSGHGSTSWLDLSPTGDTTSATLSKPFLLLGETDDTDVLGGPDLPYSTDLSRRRVPSSNDSLGDTETSSEFSPRPSLASVRIARLNQRGTFATPGLDLSSNQLEGDGATQATSTGLVSYPTSPLTPVLKETEWISGSTPRVAGDEPSTRPSASPRTMAVRQKDVSALENSRPLSEVFLSDLSEADATVRMRTILGPKTRIISPPPWDDPDGVAPGVQDEPAPSTKFRKSANTRRTEPNKPTSPNGPPSPAKENLGFKARLGNRSKSFSLLTGKKSPAHEDTFESDAALNALMPTSSPKAFGTKATPRINTGNAINGTGLSSPLSPALSVSSYGSNRTPIPSSPDSAALSSIDSERSSIPTPAVPVASACVPQSAHADVSSFAPTSSSSDLRDEQNAGYVSTSALDERNPYYVAADPDGYTSLSPPCPMGNDVPILPIGPGKNYMLISLDEARQREEDRKAAVAQRGQAAVSLSSGPRPDEPAAKQDAYDYSAERVSASINGITISSPRTNVPPPATPGTAAKTLKNRRSGFLKRMMGVSEKTEPIPRIPFLRQASPTSASFPQQVESSPSVHSSLNESPSVIGPASPTSMLQSSFLPRASSGAPPSRVAFSSMPVPDPEHRLRNVRGADGSASAPSLSLRPVSMAFSAGLPSELMAEIEAAEVEEAKLSALSADTVMRNTAALRSPHAPSFVSDTTYTSSLETAPTSPEVHSPLTSVFPVPPSQAPTSLKIVSPSRGRPWEVERAELEETIRLLRAQLYDQQECKCPECGHEFKPVLTAPSTPMSPSVVDRPRFPGHAAFGTARVLF